MIFIHRAEEPEILRGRGNAKQLALCIAYDQGTSAFSFDSSIYAHETVKETLVTMQHDKCCFCEAKITHISYGDVEHYRPKAGYRQESSESLQKPGYYWLAYAWDNLLLRNMHEIRSSRDIWLPLWKRGLGGFYKSKLINLFHARY